MRFKNLDLNLLVALDALLTERNVSRAAEKMHMTQSAMSNALARLRQFFDDDLLAQVSRGMELTPRAEGLKIPLRDILVRVDASVIAAPRFDPAQSDRVFRIYASDYTLAMIMPHFFRLIGPERYPIRFDFRPQTDQPQRTLESGEADLIIIPSEFASPDHPSQVLFREEFVCVADKDHPRIGPELTQRQYCEEPHAVMKPMKGAVSFETRALQEIGVERTITATTYSFTSLPGMVIGSDRLATVHASIARQAARLFPIQILRLPFQIPHIELAMQWHTYRSNDPAIIWLIETISAGVASANISVADDMLPSETTSHSTTPFPLSLDCGCGGPQGGPSDR